MSQVDIKRYANFFRNKLRDVPFAEVIEVTTGCKVYALSDADRDVIEEVFNASKDVVSWASNQNFTNLRPNEICNRLEERLRLKLGGVIPESKMAGYPDILIERDGKSYYIEVKLAGVNQLNSKLRSFYYEPVELAKVTRNASHILVGFIHRNKRVNGFKIVDLSKVRVSLKNEFNTNNPELYRRDNIIKEFP